MSELKRACGNCIYWSANHKEHERCKTCSMGRNNFVPRDMRCPVPGCQCGMIYYSKDAYMECPDCGTQIWPFAMEKSDKAMLREEFEKYLPCDRNKQLSSVGELKPRGIKSGSKSKGKSKKGLMQKKSTTQIFKELAANNSYITP